MSIKKQTEYQRGVAINNEGIQIIMNFNLRSSIDHRPTDCCKNYRIHTTETAVATT